MVHLIPINEHHYIGILLDRTRFPKIRVHGTLVGPLLESSIQLRQRHHRTPEFLGDRFQVSGNFRNLRGAALGGARYPHQLQVIHHDHGEIPMLP